MKQWIRVCFAAMCLIGSGAALAFQTWVIEEIYSNADRTVQYVVLRESQGMNEQRFIGGKTVTSTSGGVTQTFTFDRDLPAGETHEDPYGYGVYMDPAPTAGKRLLLATPRFAAVELLTPDFTIPAGFLSITGGTLNYAGVDQLTYTTLPTDGYHAIYRGGTVARNLAVNYNGVSVAAGPATPSTAAALNFQGMWWNASEPGWGINVAHQSDTIFATWFTYDTTGKAWWLTMTADKFDERAYMGTFYRTSGSPYSAVPYNPLALVTTAVGTGRLSFTDANNGTFAYTVNGISQTKAITRFTFAAPVPTCTFGSQSNLALATNYQDLWWNTPANSEAGWGINFTHQGNTIFATWFTYDTDGTPLWLSVTATRTSANVFTGALYRTTGPAFSATPFTATTATQVGTATFTFTNGNSATFAYTIGAVSQTKTITRTVFVSPGTTCQ